MVVLHYSGDFFNLPSVRFLHESSMYSIEKHSSQFFFAKWNMWSVKSPGTWFLKNKRFVYAIAAVISRFLGRCEVAAQFSKINVDRSDKTTGTSGL